MLTELQSLLISNARVLIMVAICVLVDTMTGISKAITNSEFSVQSKLMRKLLTKLLQYGAVIILFAGADICFGIHLLIPICIIEITIEITSIGENLKDIPKFKAMLDLLLETIKK